MSAKTIAFRQPAPKAAEDWVQPQRNAEVVAEKPASLAEPTKRLTVDIPLSLHRRMKIASATRDALMADVVRDILIKEFPDQ
jgi:hypothetical protein